MRCYLPIEKEAGGDSSRELVGGRAGRKHRERLDERAYPGPLPKNVEGFGKMFSPFPVIFAVWRLRLRLPLAAESLSLGKGGGLPKSGNYSFTFKTFR
ncbi:hypothetical protein CEXT_192171 [Caerostris extrusa]|uniref:Uncharacterized protein n=1 Tax=Caerostris extrusa TaxID=172846 RepID=A0AAV4NZM2_CAEEX|nr:hypothetical protein CEXT_192171 [Caerostris extrusa]